MSDVLSGPRSAPAALDPADGDSGWRKRVWWPVGIDESDGIVEEQAHAARRWLWALDDEAARCAVLLSLPNILGHARAVALTALSISRAENEGIELSGPVPEIEYLRRGGPRVPVRVGDILAAPRVWLELPRRAARIRSWSRLGQLPRALIAPDVVAIYHSPLLRAGAAASGRAVGYRHAQRLLDHARRSAGPFAEPPGLDAASFAATLLPTTLAGGKHRERAHALLAALAAAQFSRAARDLTALRRIRLPAEVWSASGGPYAPRAIGIEVMRRGGRVVRFDHGKPKGFTEERATNSVFEFDTSSAFVVCTPGAADICRSHGMGEALTGAPRPAISGGAGDPVFARAAAIAAVSGRAARPRVLYVPTLLLGFRQMAPAMLPDPVHLDWQLRVAESLLSLPLDLICQPHPEGLFAARPHPLERIAPTRRGNYLAQLGEADVVVFDYPSTTALWEAACTEKRIVYLDLRMGRLSPPLDAPFRARCRVLPVAYDDRGRPILDGKALADAVLSEGTAPDPGFFRSLLAGRP